MVFLNTVPDEMLEPEQVTAIDKIKEWVQQRDNRLFRVGGRAGTGKTTIIKKVLPSLKPGPVAVAAFMGKATSVLRKKGISTAQTLHSLLYKVDEANSKVGRPSFKKVFQVGCEFVVMDEGSQVGGTLFKDAWSFPHLRFLVFGDHWQLEPIDEDINLMEDPDVMLERIHRQAQNSNILKFAEGCYRGTERFAHRTLPDLRVRPAHEFWSLVKDSEQCIVGFNETRHKVNALIREHRGIKKDHPIEGERVIFLKNNSECGVYNGLVGTVTRIRNVTPEAVYFDMEDEIGQKWYDLPTMRQQYGLNSLANTIRTPYLLADFGYCITGHKSQGSEWERGVVLEEISRSWNPRRWRYTVATRFRNQDYCR